MVNSAGHGSSPSLSHILVEALFSFAPGLKKIVFSSPPPVTDLQDSDFIKHICLVSCLIPQLLVSL